MKSGLKQYLGYLFYCGIIAGALLNMPMSDRLGLGWTLVIGALLQIVAFFVQFLGLPFPAFALSFALAGIGSILQVNIIYIR